MGTVIVKRAPKICVLPLLFHSLPIETLPNRRTENVTCFRKQLATERLFNMFEIPYIRNCKSQTSELKIRNFGSEVRRDSYGQVCPEYLNPKRAMLPQNLGCLAVLKQIGFRRHVRISNLTSRFQCKEGLRTFIVETWCT